MGTNGGSVRCAGSILSQHRHICAFFNGLDEQHRVLRSFIKEGFERGDKAFHIVDSELQEDHLKRLTEAGNRRDLDAMIAFYAPDGVYDMSPVGMGVFEGQAAARGFIEDWWASYEEHEFEAEETLDLGNGVIFDVSLQKGRPVASIGYVQLRYAIVVVWAKGLIERVTLYDDIDEARAAAERLAAERG